MVIGKSSINPSLKKMGNKKTFKLKRLKRIANSDLLVENNIGNDPSMGYHCKKKEKGGGVLVYFEKWCLRMVKTILLACWRE